VLSNAQSPAARQRVSKPTAREIPTVTLTNLPLVTYSSFEPYIASIGPDYDRHRRFKKGLLEEHIRVGSRESHVIPSSFFTDLIHTKLLASMSTSNLSATSLDETPSPVQPSPRRRPRNRDADEPESLDTVPSLFFDSNFSLSNPRTFDIVNENSELLARAGGTGKPDRKSLASNAILQEKLSWYMDTVEIHLIKEINAASTSFFAALSDLQDLNEDASRCVAKIGTIREELARIQETNASGGEEVTRLHIQRANVARLQKTVDLVGKVGKMRDQIEEHLERKENSLAYQLMLDIKGMMESSETELSVNLRRVEALRNIDVEMANVLSRIGTSQGNDLTKTLITDLRAWVNSTNTQATFRRLADSFNRDPSQRKADPNLLSPAHITVPDDVRAAVIVQLAGLQQSRFLEVGMDLYRKEIVKEVKGVIKKNLPSAEDDTESVMSSVTNQQHATQDRKEKSQALAKNLRQMAPEIFLEMIMTTYASLLEFFRRLQIHQKLLLDLTALQASGTGETVVLADLSEVLSNIMDISSTRIQKILGVRAEQNSHLQPREFYVFLASTRLFSLECERINGRTPTVLMATVNSQARGFVSWLHLDRTKLFGIAVDRDKWKSEDVLPVTQKQTGLLVESATRDPVPWVRFVRVDSLENVNGVSEAVGVEKTLAIEEEKFFVVGCVVVLLGILEEYCIAMMALPPLQSDIAANVIELLKVPTTF
jgi:vacuolar protein sorting-associated protein 54